MDRRQFIIGGMAAVAAAGSVPARASDGVEPDCDHPDHPCCHHHHHAIVGSWFGSAGQVDFPAVKDLISFGGGGVVTESSRPAMRELPDGKVYVTSGHGAWKAMDEQRVEVCYRILLQSVHTGEQYGVEEVTMKLRLHDHNHLTGSWQAQITDFAGNLITSGGGDYSATRITT